MSNEIKLDWEYLEAMQGRFEVVFETVNVASELAYKVDNEISMRNLALTANDNIRHIINMILESFLSTDQNIKQEAQKIVGVEVHNSIAESMYSQPVQKHIQENLDYWLTLDDSNVNQIGINGNTGWCDQFANYVITSSGKKCPGKTIGAMYPALASENLIHGYSENDSSLNAINERYGSNISTDGYVPKTGDLVFFNWNYRSYVGDYDSVDHVGVIYVDPNDGVTYVVHGNYSNKVQKTRLDSIKDTCDHVTVADMTTYNKNH